MVSIFFPTPRKVMLAASHGPVWTAMSSTACMDSFGVDRATAARTPSATSETGRSTGPSPEAAGRRVNDDGSLASLSLRRYGAGGRWFPGALMCLPLRAAHGVRGIAPASAQAV